MHTFLILMKFNGPFVTFSLLKRFVVSQEGESKVT